MNEGSNTRVRVACDQCGIQHVPAQAVTLRCCEDDGETTVRFRCPACDRAHLDPVSPASASELAACDEVHFEVWRRPVERVLCGHDAALTPMEIDAWSTLLDVDEALCAAIDTIEDDVEAR
jgi:hypothetical protein